MKLSIRFFVLFATLFIISCNSNSNNTDTTDSTDTTSIDNLAAPIISTNATGSYSKGNQDSEDGSGYLAIEILADDSLKFELDLKGAAPNYPSGTVTGKMSMTDDLATFVMSEFDDTETEGADECKITFTFKGNDVIVKQVSGTEFVCGFGKGVFADGIYTKQNKEAIFKYEGAK